MVIYHTNNRLPNRNVHPTPANPAGALSIYISISKISATSIIAITLKLANYSQIIQSNVINYMSLAIISTYYGELFESGDVI